MNQMDITPYTGGDLVANVPYHGLTGRAAIDRWVISLDNANTRYNYHATLDGLFSTDGMPDRVCDVTIALLTAWRGAMVARTERPIGDALRISAATVNRHLAAARAFFHYWRDISTAATEHADAVVHVTFSGDAQGRALKLVKSHVEKPFMILTGDSESAAILDAATQSGAIETGRDRVARKPWHSVTGASAERDVLIITVALATGLRCAELAALTIGSLIAESRYDESKQTQVEVWSIFVRAGKNNKDRIVEINPDDAAAILAFVQASGRRYGRPDENQLPLFASQGRNSTSGGRMHPNSIRRIIDSAADRAQASGAISAGKVISPHSLRHTYAINLLRGDESQGRRPATIMEVKELLGHASIMTTQKYVDHVNRLDRAGLAPSISRLRAQPTTE